MTARPARADHPVYAGLMSARDGSAGLAAEAGGGPLGWAAGVGVLLMAAAVVFVLRRRYGKRRKGRSATGEDRGSVP
jgi:hypothetical protein